MKQKSYIINFQRNKMNQTGKWAAMLLLIVVFTVSCNTKTKETNTTKLTTIEKVTSEVDSLGASLFNQKCMICHNHEGKVDSTMLAPPFFQVKDRYLRASMDKNDFIETMSYWVKNPSEDNILMRGTVDHFEVMPYLAYSDKDIAKIVNYVYNNDIEKPEWFDAHLEEHREEGSEHGKGNGRGMGKGRGMGGNRF